MPEDNEVERHRIDLKPFSCAAETTQSLKKCKPAPSSTPAKQHAERPPKTPLKNEININCEGHTTVKTSRSGRVVNRPSRYDL